MPSFGHLVDEAEHRPGRLGVEARGGLVEQQQVGFVEDGPGQREAGPHAGGVPADLLFERVEDAEAPRRLLDALRAHRRVDAEEVGGVLEVVVAGEPVVQGGARRHHPAAPAHLAP